MTIALWIIAIVETFRMMGQMVQLKLIYDDSKKRDDIYDTHKILTEMITDEMITDEMIDEYARME